MHVMQDGKVIDGAGHFYYMENIPKYNFYIKFLKLNPYFFLNIFYEIMLFFIS